MASNALVSASTFTVRRLLSVPAVQVVIVVDRFVSDRCRDGANPPIEAVGLRRLAGTAGDPANVELNGLTNDGGERRAAPRRFVSQVVVELFGKAEIRCDLR
jgi:hypothetical protein